MEIANELVASGWFVEVIVLNADNEKYSDELLPQVHFCNLRVKRARTALPRLLRRLRRSKPSVVLAFGHQIAILLVLVRFVGTLKAVVLARTTSVISLRAQQGRGVWERCLVPWITKRLYKHVFRIIAQSRGMAGDLQKNFGVPLSKIHVIGNPRRLPRLPPSASENGNLRETSVLFVGRMEPVKDPLFLLRSFRICLSRRPELKLTILGEGSLWATVHDEIAKLNMQESVVLAGFLRDPTPFYRNSGVTVLCSLVEGLPNALIESISLGTPVVSIDCDHGPRDIIRDGVNGYLVRSRDELEFADAVLKALGRKWNADDLYESVAPFDHVQILKQYQALLSEAAAAMKHQHISRQ